MKQGEKTKRYILEQSNKLFYTKGYANTSFTDIMEATGLRKGNITYHFKTKQAILEGIIAQRLEEIETSFRKWEASSEDPVERLIAFCDMIVSQQDNLTRYGCPMGTLTAEFAKNEPTLHAIALPLFQHYRAWIAKQYMLLGADETQADTLAMSLLARVQGIAMVAHVFGDKAFLVREMEDVKQELVRDLEQRSLETG